MTLKVKDPRNWDILNCPPPMGGMADPERKSFADLRLDELSSLLYRVERTAAKQLLVALQGEFYQSANIPNFEARKERLLEDAEIIISRFDPGASYYTNAAEANGAPNANLLNPDTEWNCLSNFTTDCGLVVVSDAEVGVFWAFFED